MPSPTPPPPPRPNTQWNSPVPDYDILTDEACKLLFSQSQAFFEETIEEMEELTQRSTRMLFLLLPAVATIVGFCILNQERFNRLNSFAFVLLLSAAVCLGNCIYLLFRLMGPKSVSYRGTRPKELMRPEIFTLRDIKQVEKAIYVSEIERYQIKIEHMEYQNYKRIVLYQDVIASFFGMIFMGVLLLIISICQS